MRAPPSTTGLLLASLSLCGCAHADGPAPPPSVILVSLDTTRADRLGCYGAERDTTPNLDRFARESTLFTHAYSQANSTGPSHASLFTSLYPTEAQGSGGVRTIRTDAPLLSEVFSAYGYDTGAFVAGGDLNPVAFETRGFQTYTSSVDFGSLWHTIPKALAWLDGLSGDKPVFAFVHGYDAHASYLKPAPFGFAYGNARHGGAGGFAVRHRTDRVADGLLLGDSSPLEHLSERFLRPRSQEARDALVVLAAASPIHPRKMGPKDLQLIRDVYDGAIAYEDMQFGRLMAGLDARGMLDHSVVVVFGDHGEQLGEDGLFNHCCGASDAETHVPLLIRLPGGGPARRVDGIVELVDVMPTLLELAGAVPPAVVRGHSLVPALRGEPFEGREMAFTEAGLGRYITSARSAEGRLTYTGMRTRFATLPDFIEVARLPGPGFGFTEGLAQPDRERLRAGLVRWLRALTPLAGDAVEAELPAQLQETLRAHGYWDAGK